jgi:hypothetical protein
MALSIKAIESAPSSFTAAQIYSIESRRSWAAIPPVANSDWESNGADCVAAQLFLLG